MPAGGGCTGGNLAAALALRSGTSNLHDSPSKRSRAEMALQTLPRISRPTGAIAVVAQASQTRSTPPPRGMSLPTQHTHKRMQRIPAAGAAGHLGALQRGYLAARTVVSAESALEVQMMLAAENRELFHAAARVCAPDRSLPPRPVAVTLMAFGNEGHCKAAHPFLDALAHLAGGPLVPDVPHSPLVASLVRMSVFAGVDAQWFLEQTAREALDSAPSRPVPPGEVLVVVRWANAHAPGNIRSEFHALRIGQSLDQSLQSLQNCFMSMKINFMAPFPASIAHSRTNVHVDAWASALHTASEAFFDMAEGRPCVLKAHALQGHEDRVSIESTGIVARICPKTAQLPGPEGAVWTPLAVQQAIVRPDAFHAFIVGNSACLPEIATFAKMNEVGGLPPPDEDTARYCLHTCAVQANAYELRERISLYATHHRVGGRLPGTPINSPGSWIWRFEPAIVAVEAVLNNFYVVPCADESAFPGDPKLTRPFNQFFNRAFSLHADTFGGARQADKTTPFERMPLGFPEVTQSEDPSLHAAEDYALTAFSLDASSRRMSVGDAFATLEARQAPPQLTDLMLQASLQLGVNSSVLDAMALAAQALKQMADNSPAACKAQSVEVARLKRVADAAIDAAPKRACKLQVASVPICRVKSVLAALRLRKAESAIMPSNKAVVGDYVCIVSVLASCVLSQHVDDCVHAHACEVARRARGKGELASLSAATTVLRASPSARPVPTFVLCQAEDSDVVSCNRVGFNGSFDTATMGEVVDSPARAVLLLHMCAKGVRVTSTKSV